MIGNFLLTSFSFNLFADRIDKCNPQHIIINNRWYDVNIICRIIAGFFVADCKNPAKEKEKSNTVKKGIDFSDKILYNAIALKLTQLGIIPTARGEVA